MRRAHEAGVDVVADVQRARKSRADGEALAAGRFGAIVVEIGRSVPAPLGCRDLDDKVRRAGLRALFEPSLDAQARQVGEQQHRAFVAPLLQWRAGPQLRHDCADALLVDGRVGGNAHVDLAEPPLQNADFDMAVLDGLLRHDHAREKVALGAIRLRDLGCQLLEVLEGGVAADVRRDERVQRRGIHDAVAGEGDRLQRHGDAAGRGRCRLRLQRRVDEKRRRGYQEPSAETGAPPASGDTKLGHPRRRRGRARKAGGQRLIVQRSVASCRSR